MQVIFLCPTSIRITICTCSPDTADIADCVQVYSYQTSQIAEYRCSMQPNTAVVIVVSGPRPSDAVTDTDPLKDNLRLPLRAKDDSVCSPITFWYVGHAGILRYRRYG
jgi:hypothetical protein